MSTYFNSNACPEHFHYFLRDEEDQIVAFHADDSDCKLSEHSFADMQNDEVGRIYSCPWCLKQPVDSDHIRKCSGYTKPYTRAEIEDCYSEPSESAKREAMLSTLSK